MLKLMRKSKKNRYLPHFCFSLVVVTLNVIWLERELGTDGHRVAALMYTHSAVIERGALCQRQLRNLTERLK